MYTGKYQQQSFWNEGDIYIYASPAEVTGIFGI
jgi:hypothetical protein